MVDGKQLEHVCQSTVDQLCLTMYNGNTEMEKSMLEIFLGSLFGFCLFNFLNSKFKDIKFGSELALLIIVSISVVMIIISYTLKGK